MKVTEHLDALGRALALRGVSSVPKYDQIPPRQRVFLPETPRFGDSLHVEDGPDGEPWFYSSTGAPLAPVRDVTHAAERIARELAAYLPVVRPPQHHSGAVARASRKGIRDGQA
ncbi:hypothetical protein ACGFNU_38970 [Spirillospora sp. NPDC048911]|uniref:hypothetical protein n=1 Tax=Spirillospora sp. NPDC048911 TaxID=3364527 RepID=UPI00371C3EE9